MPEHAIRLRAAWDWLLTEGGSQVVRRVDLPTDWPPGLEAPFRLRRGFGRPPGAGTTRLELARVPGLVAARLNGRPLPGPAGDSVDWSVPLVEALLPRNVLVLEVDFRRMSGPPRDWGAIALVVSSGA